MRRLLPLALLAFLPGCNSTTSWQEQRDQNGCYRIEVPAGKVNNMGLGRGAVLLYELPGMTLIASFEMSLDGLPKGSSNAQLDGLRDEQVRDRGWTLLAEEPRQLSGCPGREVRFRTKNGDLARVRFYVLANRAFALNVIAGPDRIDGPDARRFLDSFQVLVP